MATCTSYDATNSRTTVFDNPADNPASFTAFPILIAYSTDDPVCTAATVTAFGAAAGATMVNLGAVGHTTAGLSAQTVIDFLNRNA